MRDKRRGPLDGLLVVEFCQYLAGPSAGLRLADLGARVIKVERPVAGDACRQLNVKDMWLDGDSFPFHTFNRNKESFAADLKNPEDLEKVRRLIERADVVTHNFRPGVMEKLGLSYTDVARINPGIVYGVVTGYGSEGPWRDLPGQDLLVQARSGLIWLSGNGDQPPVPFGLSMVDMYTAAHLVQGLLAALVRRRKTGAGALIEVSLLESAIDMQFEFITTYLNDGNRPPCRSRINNAHAYLAAPYGIYKTADGYISIAMGSVVQLGEAIGLPELARFSDPAEWFKSRDEIKAILAAHLVKGRSREWLERLGNAGYWAADVLQWDELIASDGFKALDMILEVESGAGRSFRTTRCPIRFDGEAPRSARPAPKVGEHTARILAELETGAPAREEGPEGAGEDVASSGADRPLEGLIVLDMGQFLSAPSAALRLADLGARVIKVERPNGGDICRRLYITDVDLDGDSTLFHSINRNREGVTVDLKSPEGIQELLRLVRRADVLIQNFRPGVMERLGLDDETLMAANPRLVYASICGYGPTGPWRDLPGQDLLVQGLSGLVWHSGDQDHGPVPMGISVVDLFAGAHLVQGILACLAERERTGRGGRVQVSLMESAVDIQFEVLTQFLNDGGQRPERSKSYNAHPYVGAPYGVFPTRDGHLALGMGSVTLLGELLECPELSRYDDPADWFRLRDEIKTILAERLRAKPTASWLAVLEPAGVWCAEALNWAALLQHDGFKRLHMIQEVDRGRGKTMPTTRCPIRIDGRPLTAQKGAPLLGEDTARIMAEFS